jgi:ribosomal protein S18 acetylase RimI-like enzyme
MNIRQPTPADIPDLARIHVAGWQAAYGGLVGQDYLDSQNCAEYEGNWTRWLESPDFSALIAHDGDGKAAGFVSFGRLRTPPPGMSPIRPLYAAEIYALYILPEYWRAGLGRQLLAAAAENLKERKLRSLCLWVLEGNTRAVAFYKALGGQKCGTKRVEIGGKTLPEAAFGWRDTTILQKPFS